MATTTNNKRKGRKGKRKPTAAQREAAQQKREKLQAMIRTLADMNNNEREAVFAQCPLVTNPDGRPLSPRNTWLLCQQFMAIVGTVPTMVGGFRQWQQHDRRVAKGAVGVYLLIPKIGKAEDDPDGEDVLKGFTTGTVFDVSQTVPMDSE